MILLDILQLIFICISCNIILSGIIRQDKNPAITIDSKGAIMKWVTREKAKVDRIACPWLIRRFVDHDAVFEYLPADTDWHALQTKLGSNGFVYDVPNCVLGHHGEECSFDAIITHFKLDHPALRLMAKIVRAADTPNKNLALEGIGLEAIAEGFRRIAKDDFDNQRLQFPMYDALFAYCSTQPDKPTR